MTCSVSSLTSIKRKALSMATSSAENTYPRYMSKVNAHYERIDPRNGVRNSVPGVDSIVMCIVKVHSQQIDHRNGVFHSVSGVNPFIMRIYFAHVTGVTEDCSGREKERVSLPHTNAQPTPSSVLEPSVKARVEPWYRDKCSMARDLNSSGRRSVFLTSDRDMSICGSTLFHGGNVMASARLTL